MVAHVRVCEAMRTLTLAQDRPPDRIPKKSRGEYTYVFFPLARTRMRSGGIGVKSGRESLIVCCEVCYYDREIDYICAKN